MGGKDFLHTLISPSLIINAFHFAIVMITSDEQRRAQERVFVRLAL